jgi:DNA polymerase
VPGAGNPQADILFIGEGPGKKEDEQGAPFVGAAGKFLNELLDSIGVKREEVFIANVVKCRPPGNRDPLPAEIETCLPYLKTQILLIQPKIIVTLGRFSMHLFIPGASISKIHGQIQQQRNLLILPLYHPAVALYNGGMREVLKKDFAVLGMILKKVTPKK